MTGRFETLYKIKPKTNLNNSRIWNNIFQDIDLRLVGLELLQSAMDTAIQQMIDLGISRLNETFEPLIADAEYRLNTFGAVFSAVSLSSITIGTGNKTFVVTEDTREGYSPTDYISIRSQANSDNAMVGQLVSFNRTNGELVVNVTYTSGSGTFAAWDLRLGMPPDLAHATDLDNPHQTTAEQVNAYTKAAVDSMFSARDAALPAAIETAVTELTGSLGSLAYKSAISIGDLSSLIATQAEAEAGVADNKLMTPLKVQQRVALIEAVTLATLSEFLTGNTTKAVPSNVLLGSQAYVYLTDAAPISWSQNLGFNFKVTIADNRTLAFPTNPVEGKSGIIEVTQPVTGGKTLSFASGFSFDGGVAPVIDAGVSRKTALFWHQRTTSECWIALAFAGVRAAA